MRNSWENHCGNLKEPKSLIWTYNLKMPIRHILVTCPVEALLALPIKMGSFFQSLKSVISLVFCFALKSHYNRLIYTFSWFFSLQHMPLSALLRVQASENQEKV